MLSAGLKVLGYAELIVKYIKNAQSILSFSNIIEIVINMGLTEWEKAKHRIKIGSRIRGIVKSHAPFGIFVDIGDPIALGLIQITDFSDEGRMTPDLYPPIGTEIEAVVLAFTDERRKQVWMSMKDSVLNE